MSKKLSEGMKAKIKWRSNEEYLASALKTGNPLKIIPGLWYYFRRKQIQKETWKWYEGVIDLFKEYDVPGSECWLKAAEDARTRKDIESARSVANEILGVLERYCKLDKKRIRELEEMEMRGANKQEPEPVDEKYLIVPQKTYNLKLSGNQKKRLQYFLDDTCDMIPSEQKKELYRNIRESGWYSNLPIDDDIATYMFFDDITLSLRKGEIPSLSKLSDYVVDIALSRTTKNNKKK